VDFQVLQNRKGHVDMMSELVNRELVEPRQSDLVLFLGPTTRFSDRMPHDLMLKGMNVVHRGLLKVSGGRVGWSGMGMPVVELTTIGRKSGQRRSVMLTSPISDGDSMIIVASRGGDDTGDLTRCLDRQRE
jgi:hypothetical protein